jgi:uncharacterized membrane protein
MEPHSWIFAISGMAYLYFLCRIFDMKKVYIIKKSRIHQPSDTDQIQLDQWKTDVSGFKKEMKSFRVKSVTMFSIIPATEILTHAYFGNHLAQVWFISLILCAAFLLGLFTLLYDMKQYDRFEEKKYKSATSLLYV